MFYELFLNYIRDLYIKENSGTITWEEIKESPMWLYMISCFSEHTVGIEAIIKSGYKPINFYFRETLSGKYPIIRLNENKHFLESTSGPSDLIPSVTFLLPNIFGTEKLSDMRILRIEFGKAGLAPLD